MYSIGSLFGSLFQGSVWFHFVCVPSQPLGSIYLLKLIRTKYQVNACKSLLTPLVIFCPENACLFRFPTGRSYSGYPDSHLISVVHFIRSLEDIPSFGNAILYISLAGEANM